MNNLIKMRLELEREMIISKSVTEEDRRYLILLESILSLDD